MTPKKFRCLFIINGLGLGNSTRCHAVMAHLIAAGVETHVITSGNGLKFFSGKEGIASLRPMEAFFYSGANGRINPWKTMLSLGKIYRLARLKRKAIVQALEEIRPHAVVTDSEYIVRPARRCGIAVLSINNSDVIVSSFRELSNPPREIIGQYRLIEWPDYLWHSRQPDEVLSPSARNIPPAHERIHRVGLIIRNELREHIRRNPPPSFPAPRELRRVLFMLSGSIFATPIPLASHSFPFQVDVVGMEGVNQPGLTYHGKLMNNFDLLVRADALVINAGFSAVSEALALGKPTLVIPVHGHAEQYINALTLQQMGGGYMTTEAGVLGLLDRLLEDNCWTGLAPRQEAWSLDGAREAADRIVERMKAGGGADS